MKKTNKIAIPFILLIATLLVCGCQKKKVECPFTTLSWGSTLEDVVELEGECEESYDSVYGGTTYTYPKEYAGLNGTIKYMFDDGERLVCLSWLYEGNDSEDLKSTYDKIHGEAEKMLGESGYQLNSEKFAEAASPNDVWYMESGNVVLTMVDTGEVKALQYTFLHPDVSQEKPEK